MANQIVSMTKLRKFLRLRIEGLSLRKISELTGMSRNTVLKYREVFEKHCGSLAELLQLSDKELYSVAHPPAVEKPTHEDLYRLFPEMEKRLARVGMTRHIIWEQYKEQHPEGVQYSQFCEHYKRYIKSRQITCILEHKAGDKMMVDYAGKKLHLVDAETGGRRFVEFFVAILPCSQYTYAEASMSQQSPDFLHCLGNALRWFGGVPQAIVTDNLKPAINRASKYDPEINHSMSDFAEHYDTAVLPTRARKPKDKALVESAINILYTRVYAPLHDRTFHTLAELNKAIWELVAKHNLEQFKGKPTCRREQFETIERETLKPLAEGSFEIKKYCVARVQPNCHVMLSEDKHHYSVPYQHIGQKVEIGYTTQAVEVYFKHERIAVHPRTRLQYRHTTNEVHLHPHQRFYRSWSREFFVNQGIETGPNTQMLIEQVFIRCKHPEQAYKMCQGVLQLAGKHGSVIIEAAASLCLQHDGISYSNLDRIIGLIKSGFVVPDSPDESTVIIEHGNIRGKSYYQ